MTLMTIGRTVVATIAAASTVGFAQAPNVKRAADVVVPAGVPTILELPVNPAATIDLLQQLLTRSDVRFGLEEAPILAGAAPLDLARQPEKEVRLNGLRLGDALDRIVAADPRYEWREVDGRILVMAPAGSAEQLPVRPFALKDASPAAALDSLMRALDADRASGGIVGAGVDSIASSSVATQPDPRPAPRGITLNFPQGTLVAALDAIVASRPDLSWTIRQDASGNIDGVGVILSTSRASFMAMPDRAIRERRLGGNRITVPVTHGLRGALSLYAQKARQRIGFESVPMRDSLQRPPGGGMLDLGNLLPIEAIARVVALDSRYVWTDAGEVFNVRPAPDVLPSSSLDRPVPGFTAADDTVDTILDRIVILFGSKATGAGEGWGSAVGSPERAKAEADRQSRLSFQLGPTTVREILNALSRTKGTLSWDVTVTPNPDGRFLVTVDVSSWNGWNAGRSFTTTTW